MADTTGWCPFAQEHRTVKFGNGNQGRRAVVLHIAQGAFAGSLDWLRNENSNPNSSAHFIVAKDGRIAQLVSVHNWAWANGLCWQKNHWLTRRCTRIVQPGWVDIQPGENPNKYTISIEHEGFTGEALTPAMEAATVRLLRWIREVFNITYVPGRTLIGHRDIDPLDRAYCPGSAFDFARLAQEANRGAEGITEDTKLLSAPRASVEQARAYIVGRGSVYTPIDIGVVVGHYWRNAVPANIDPLLAVAQSIHETSERDPATGKWRPMSSWWAQRPRRNPAGLGVTGQTRTDPPPAGQAWEIDTRPEPPIWRAGLRFDTWEEAARAHIGRLLAYAIPAGGGTEEQRALIAFALEVRPLPAALRGSATILKALGARHNPTGQGWANPGDQYGSKVAEIAQKIAEVQT